MSREHPLRRRPILVALLCLAAAAAAGCRERRPAAAPDAARGDAGAPEERAESAVTGDEVVYDARGVPVPHPKRLGLGTPIPAGFELLQTGHRRSTYGGPVPGEKLVEFYREYLTCSYIAERRKGTVFDMANPKAPGDETRLVSVLVLPRGHGGSRVIITDKTALPDTGEDAGPADPEYFERFRAKAHGGTGSVSEPIPGTY